MILNGLPRVGTIGRIEALRVLADSLRHRILTLLIQAPRTAGELADELGLARTRLYYQLNLLEEHGFIQVVSERIVSGIKEKSYRATAQRFKVDHGLLAAAASAPEIADAQASILEQTAEDLRVRAHSGDEQVDAEDTNVLVSRSFGKLSPERYADLRERLSELINAFAQEPEEQGVGTELVVALFTNEREHGERP